MLFESCLIKKFKLGNFVKFCKNMYQKREKFAMIWCYYIYISLSKPIFFCHFPQCLCRGNGIWKSWRSNPLHYGNTCLWSTSTHWDSTYRRAGRDVKFIYMLCLFLALSREIFSITTHWREEFVRKKM